MELITFWLFFSAIIGAIGSNRLIGFWGAFLLSLVLSPIIGLIFTITSKRLSDIKHEQALSDTNKKQEEILSRINLPPIPKNDSIITELERLKILKDENIISDTEFEQLKSKLFNNT